MTSLYFDPAQFSAPSEQEPRDQLIVNGRYMLPPIGDPTGKRRSLQRVTNFIKQLSDQEGLVKWKLRSVVEGLVLREDLYDLACSLDLSEIYDRDQIIERCIDAAKSYKGSGGNETGTALHNYTDAIGKEPMRVRPKWAPKVENYRAALHAKGLRPVPGLSERLVVSERYGTCGRLDDVYEDPFGVLRVGDRKSQKDFYTWWEVGAQLALYQSSEAMWNEAECRWEDMPKLADDVAHVAWMPLNHPVAKAGGDVDMVTIYDIPLAGPREVLEWCAKVRELRTGARKWGQERLDLDDFARVARDIRDAETRDDLRKLAEANPALVGSVAHGEEASQLNAMAARRWEELVDAHRPEQNALGNLAAAANGSGVAQQLSPDPTTRALQYAAVDAVAPPAEVQLGPSEAELLRIEERMSSPIVPTRAAVQGTLSQDSPAGQQALLAIRATQQAGPNGFESHEAYEAAVTEVGKTVERGKTFTVVAEGHMFDPALFRAPEQDATFPSPNGSTGGDVSTPGRAPGAVVPELLKPAEWAAQLDLSEQFHVKADPEGRWCAPMTRDEFETYFEQNRVPQAHSAASVPFTYSKHEGATVVELPEPKGEDSSPGWDPVNLRPTLDAVPVKIVREIHTRANNSKTSRGRVRLLNDLEKKYEKHQEALLPALLREWLVLDGLAGEPGFNKDGIPRVANTGGSSREPMDARLARGAQSLTDYLATKGEGGPVPDAPQKGDAAPAQGDEDTKRVAEKIQEFADSVAAMRHQYAGIGSEHSIKRLVEMAQKAQNGAERAKVFHEITKRRAWTGEIAAEINQYYLDNGYAIEDFDPYFEAVAIEGSALPRDPDDPSTVEDAIHLLSGVETLAGLQAMWGDLAKLPFFAEQRLQEALMAKFAKVKA